MANISNFFGELTIPSSILERCKYDLVGVVDGWNENRGYYGINYCDTTKEEILTATGGLVIKFDGDGRWNFFSSVEAENCDELVFRTDVNPAARAFLYSVKGVPLPFWFIDEESGCELLYKWSGVYLDGQFIGEEESYDYTAENLVELGCYDSVEEVNEWLNPDEED